MNARNQIPAALSSWAYFLDVDGTLMEFSPTPDTARLERPTLELLARLRHVTDGALALVSGRTLADLERRFGALSIPCCGQHGLERRDSDGRLHVHKAPSASKEAIQLALTPILARYRGLMLEDKGLSLSLHYRHAPRQAAHVHGLMRRLVSEAGPGLQLQAGKFVVEVKPSGVDKGSAIREYLSEPPFLGRCPIYIGDDLSDEHAFQTVNRVGGISIKVGKGKTNAQHRLPNVAAVLTWLSGATKGIR